MAEADASLTDVIASVEAALQKAMQAGLLQEKTVAQVKALTS